MGAKIRRATASDKQDILEISRHVWEGHDYLPLVIDDWFKDLNAHVLGIQVDDHLVAVANLRLIENGQTGWMEGLRVHPDYRGRGFANALTDRIVRMAKDLAVKRLRYTTSSENEASLKVAAKFRFAKILEKSVFWLSELGDIDTTVEYARIEVSTTSVTYKLLQANPRLIPHKVLVYDWKALDATRRSLDTIAESHDFYIALKRMKIDSLSFGYSRGKQEPSVWAFTIYATEPNGFLAHLFHNVGVALEKDLKALMGTHDTIFESTLRRLKWVPDDYWSTRMFLLEKVLP
ncbi:MAG: GNAT family N-acetyltransferase [Candidatus Bathyarchaeota archaeon]|nr:MAG: GNAT family N-acetyltransferase [Candidatus Bathyarchaeota archaeon]